MFWYIGVLITDVYIMYVNINDSNGFENRDLVYHHNFHKAITISWINSTKYRVNCTATISTISKITPNKPRSYSVSTSSPITLNYYL